MRWRPHVETPPADAEVFTALIAVEGPDGGFHLIKEIFNWKDGCWRDEDFQRPLVLSGPFWWLPEEELLATVGTAPAQRDAE